MVTEPLWHISALIWAWERTPNSAHFHFHFHFQPLGSRPRPSDTHSLAETDATPSLSPSQSTPNCPSTSSTRPKTSVTFLSLPLTHTKTSILACCPSVSFKKGDSLDYPLSLPPLRVLFRQSTLPLARNHFLSGPRAISHWVYVPEHHFHEPRLGSSGSLSCSISRASCSTPCNDLVPQSRLYQSLLLSLSKTPCSCLESYSQRK